ncbi:SAF domain-containing protein [Streptomyces diastaticus]|uniref:SAF domain-containing protein n=3 Tax=Streptomyces TaxID=1883 RepID=A0ABQ1CRR7_STRDI|nr:MULTISPECIES: SAF domain-containing protein [Streptomyces]MBF4138219.1 hypothetical protein [Streptomyces albidoflavus]NEE58134.1 hypothetical protein [Streptomyces sp. SID8455]GFH72883.1 hypothetical protein Sdia_36510 [Streptomyces diastaticus subsp. diastaticus]GGU45269.1 hypothetical protein GCM10015534_54760 [Streptomyces diastaticus subsp. diastaticus]
MKTKQEAAPATAGVPEQIKPVATVSARGGRRKSPAMLALSALLIAGGAGGGYLAWEKTGERTPVLVVAADVAAGDVIEEGDLARTSVSLDPAVKAIPAELREKVVGKRAAVPLVPGSLLSPKQVTDRTLVRPGEQLVGISLKPSRLPATRLSAGDTVQVVSTPGQAAGDEEADAQPDMVEARVVRVGPKAESGGERVLDVAVPKGRGPLLAARAANGNVAVVVDAADGS